MKEEASGVIVEAQLFRSMVGMNVMFSTTAGLMAPKAKYDKSLGHYE